MTRLAERMSRPAKPSVVTVAAIDEAPQDDDELYAFVTSRLGLVMPRESTCDGHDSVFQVFADLYFGRRDFIVAIAGRQGGKSTMTAALHLCCALFRPGFHGCILGPEQAHAEIIYRVFQTLLRRHGGLEGNDVERHPLVEKSIQSETVFTNGSRVEILPATAKRVHGLHPHLLTLDEAELIESEAIFEDTRHMSAAMQDGFPGIDLITSTRRSSTGRMQRLVDEHDSYVAENEDPPFAVVTWCFREAAAQVPNCRMAPENAGRPDDELCQCHRVRKGTWEGTNDPRTFDQVCNGSLFHASGHMLLSDLHKKFRASPPEVWAAQQECSHPYTSRAVLPRFSRARHCVLNYVPEPGNGPIFFGLDLGDGPNHSHCVWIQLLTQPVTVKDLHGQEKELRAGTRVVFDEWYMAEAGNLDLHRGITGRERYWRGYFESRGDWRVNPDGRFSDVSGRTRVDFKQMSPPISLRSLHKDVLAQVAMLVDLLDEDELVIDLSRCELLVKELESWHRDARGNIVKRDDHGPDALRYGLWGMKVLEKQIAAQTVRPGAGPSPHRAAAGESPWATANRPLSIGPHAGASHVTWADIRRELDS